MLKGLRRLWDWRRSASANAAAPKLSDSQRDELTNDVRSALEEAERQIARMVEANGGEYVPLLADIRALGRRPVDASLLAAVVDLSQALPYQEDKFQTWITRGDAKFLTRLRAAGVDYGDLAHASGKGGDVLDRLHYRVARALRLAAHAGPRRPARLPGERVLDVGRHRLHFFEPEDGGGFVIDEGWYVPVGYARTAALAASTADGDYVVVDTVACPSTRSSGGLCLVETKNYGFSRVTREPTSLDAVSFHPDGFRRGTAGPLHTYASLTFTTCLRR